MKSRKDVLFLCQFFYPEYVSSATLPYDTALALSQEGFKVDVLCGYPSEYTNDKAVPFKEIHKGINIMRLNYIQMNRRSFFGRLINYFSFTLSMFTKLFCIRNYKTVIVYSNPPILPLVASLANMVFGTKIIFVSYDIYPEIAIRTNMISRNGITTKVMKMINNSLYKRVTKVIALSIDMKEELLKLRSELNENQIEVIPNWFEDRPIDDFKKSYNNELFAQVNAEKNMVVSYFGNMGTAQDVDTLINAIKILKHDTDISFILAGHGNKLPVIKEAMEKEQLKNIFIYDFLHGQDFQDALNISDVFVVSLEKNITGLAVPSKTYSYMMAGKPIISIMGQKTDISRELIKNKAGYSIENDDVSNLVAALEYLKNNEKDRLSMGENSRKLFEEKYTTQKSTSKYVRVMKEILEDK